MSSLFFSPSQRVQIRVSAILVTLALTGSHACAAFNMTKSVTTADSSLPKPHLTIEIKDIGDTATAVKNQKDVNLLRFEARATDGDVDLTSTTFVAQQGSLLNATNYSLWMDTDGQNGVDTLLQSGGWGGSGKIIFDNMKGEVLIAKNDKITFEVHADIASTLSSDRLQIGFDTSSQTCITAKDSLTGRSLLGIKTSARGKGDITLINRASIVYQFTTAGNLFVTQEETPGLGEEPTTETMLLGGNIYITQNLNFRATGEAIDVKTIHIAAIGNADSIARVLLYKEGKSVPFAIATRGATKWDIVPDTYHGQPITTLTARMEAHELIVPKDDDIQVTVRVEIEDDFRGGKSGDPIQLIIMGTPATINDATGEGAIHAIGVTSGRSLKGNNGDNTMDGEVFIGTKTTTPNDDIVSSMRTVVMSKLVAATNASPDSDGTPLGIGTRTIAQFKLKSALNVNAKNNLNSVVIDQLYFTMNLANVLIEPGTLKIYNKNDASKMSDCTMQTVFGGIFMPASRTILVTCANLASSPMNTEMKSNAEETFVLEAKIGDSMAFPFLRHGSLQVTADFGENFKWFDHDAVLNRGIDGTDLAEKRVTSTLYGG